MLFMNWLNGGANMGISEVVVSIHQTLLAEHGGTSGVRDKALLESALNRPRQRTEL